MRKWATTLWLAGVTLAAGLGSSAADRAAIDTRIAGAIYLGDVPTVVADAKGFFRQEGVSAKTAYHPSGKDSLAALRAGEADFALTALTPVVLDRLADQTPGTPDDPVILASLVHSNDLLHIVTAAASGIDKPADLHGKRIAINRGTNAEFVWWLYRQYHALEASEIEVIDMRFPDMAEALEAGHIDAALLWEPWVSRVNAPHEAKPGRARHFHLLELYAGKWVLVTTRRTAREQEGLCRSVLNAYKQAIDFIEAAPDTTISLYRERIPGADRIDPQHWHALDYDLNLDWSLIAGLQEQLHWAETVGYGGVDQPVQVLELIEPGPLSREWPGAVGIPIRQAGTKR